MGAAFSGHTSCPDHRGRGLKRADSNDVAGRQCGVCQLPVEVGVRVHHCSEARCGYVLHDSCFRLPATIRRHFAHPGHPLTLAAVGGGGRSYYCTLCARQFAAHAYAYSCAAAAACATGGFRAHPRCCLLPETMADAALHPHGRLVLRDGDGARRRCLKCRTTTAAGRRPPAAWSYQCADHNDTEICLACVLGVDGDAARCCCCCCCVPGPGYGCGGVEPGRLGEWIGNLLRGIGYGMGLPCFTAQSAAAPAIRK